NAGALTLLLSGAASPPWHRARLSVLADGVARRIAWPALSLARADPSPPAVTLLVPSATRTGGQEAAAAVPLEVYTAAQFESSALAPLAGARGTGGVLRRALPQLAIQVHERATRAQVLQALQRP